MTIKKIFAYSWHNNNEQLKKTAAEVYMKLSRNAEK